MLRVVFAKRTDRLSRNFFNLVSSLFAKTYSVFVSNISNFQEFFQNLKKKFRRLEKNRKKFTCIRTNSKSEAVDVQFFPPRARISTLD